MGSDGAAAAAAAWRFEADDRAGVKDEEELEVEGEETLLSVANRLTDATAGPEGENNNNRPMRGDISGS